MTARPGPQLLDVTRLVSRLGRGPMTGIDRVEAAYLHWLTRPDLPHTRLWLGWRGRCLLLAPGAGPALLGVLTPPAGGMRGRLRSRWQALRALRPHVLAVPAPAQVARALRDAFPDGGQYWNLGHTHLDGDRIAAIRAGGLGVQAMVHDTIPVDLPALARSGSVARFRAHLQAAAAADRIIAPTQAAAAAIRAQLGRAAPPILPVPLGIGPPAPATATPGLIPPRPYMLALGTIEPRKNHDLLLDLWETRAGVLPDLVIAGARGWASPALFARLAAAVRTGRVHAHHTLNDGQVSALMDGACALVFPTLAEGFGLPAAEAAARGLPVLCSDLPVLRETLGNYPVYADPHDRYRWIEEIEQLTCGSARANPRKMPHPMPTWTDHFTRVFKGV